MGAPCSRGEDHPHSEPKLVQKTVKYIFTHDTFTLLRGIYIIKILINDMWFYSPEVTLMLDKVLSQLTQQKQYLACFGDWPQQTTS